VERSVNKMKASLFYSGIISFALGVFLRSLVSVHVSFTLFLMLLVGVFFVYGIFLKKTSKQIFGFILTLSFTLSFFVLGIVRYEISDQKRGDPLLSKIVGETLIIQGVVSDEPDLRENNVRLTVDFEKVFLQNKTAEVKSRGIVTADFYPEFEYGDRLKISGVFKKPENFENELGKEFNYVEFLAKDGIYYQMFRPKIELLSKDDGNFIKEKIFGFKRVFLEKIKNAVPEPEASLSGGLLLGTKQSLGKETLDQFRQVGLIHIVVLSGYNITIVAESFMKTLGFFLSQRLAGIFGIVGIVLFAIMTGAGATVVRASLMVILVIIARLYGREYEVNRALFLAGFVMLMHNPKILLFDPSFQLSFVAMLGLVHVSPIVLRYMIFLTPRFGIRELAASTLATQIFVLPLILYMMGNLSLVALPVNLLVLAFVPITMFLSFVTGVVGFFSNAFSIPFGFISYLLLSYMFKIAELFASLPFASVTISYFPLWLMILVYAVYGYVLLRTSNKAGSPMGDPALSKS